MFKLKLGYVYWDDGSVDVLTSFSFGDIGRSYCFTIDNSDITYYHIEFSTNPDESGKTLYYDATKDYDEVIHDYRYHEYEKTVKGLQIYLE